MTKKEQAQFEQMKGQLRLKGALRSTSPVEPDVPIPERTGLSTGFLPLGEQGDHPAVEPACSSSVHHGIGKTHQVSSQGARRLYSTRLRALQALRYMVEQTCAQRLAAIDKMIEEETETA